MGVYLFKKAAIVLFVFALLHGASAYVYLIEPSEETLSSDNSVELGRIAVGETLEIVVQRKSGLESSWDTLVPDSTGLPSGWGFESRKTDKTLIGSIKIPKTAEESVQKLSFKASNSSNPFYSETFSVYVTVKKNLLRASMENLSQSVMVNDEAVFRVIVNNDSIASHTVVVSSTLPNYWFEPVELDVPALEALEANVLVKPASHGKRFFSFSVSSALNDFESNFNAELFVSSSLRGKFASGIAGFPFFNVSLLPHFIINAFLALLS